MQVPFKVPRWLTLPSVPAADELDAALRAHGMRPPYLCKVEQVSCRTPTRRCPACCKTAPHLSWPCMPPLLLAMCPPPFARILRPFNTGRRARCRRAVLRTRTTWRCSAAARTSPPTPSSSAPAPSQSRPATSFRNRSLLRSLAPSLP